MKPLPPYFQERAGVVKTGEEHYITWMTDDNGTRIGFLEWHDCTAVNSDYLTAGSVIFDIPEAWAYRPEGAKWQVHSLDPLHVEPSILCRNCGNHGFIRNGKWEDA